MNINKMMIRNEIETKAKDYMTLSNVRQKAINSSIISERITIEFRKYNSAL